MMVKDLVAYAVSRINIRRTTAISQNVCPRVLFTGMRVDYQKELSLAFGDYCEVFDGTDNMSRQRSVPCIALYPCCNTTGSWVFFSMQSQKWLRCTIWKKMGRTNEIIKQMNALVKGSVAENAETMEQILGEQVMEQETAELANEPSEEPGADLASDPDSQDGVPELEPAGGDESNDEAENDEDSDEESEPEPRLRRSERLKAGTRKPTRYAVHMKLRAGSHNAEEINA
jgi:hypothetical protein